ncbi:carboxy-S-adenosyl-L-methionine synthase CmoA [Ferrimonas lipolytica]|uniref:Carboxy-S-adenosyl-L-methionine synthase n=1 Tax=Ferrimonas lipolytica TaxID=2724191 RepID=A0A6H1UBK7_9GAMM|nr:carboxy-S-adenosyl-L-methionine synthase CmoA [Ferrimonas lipolytica]QIZ76441.1 carboxy-S-adenosyl-L-methionine synthase CmoA [Ferrimonas lipolytica]
MSSKHDQIFSQPHQVSDFRFDEKVVAVFPDMISRSVPGYAEILNTLSLLSSRFVCANSNVYDLGCSLGAASLAMRRGIKQDEVKIVAIDNSEAMITRASEHLDAFVSDVPVELHCADIREVEISNASMVVLNFTMQFLAPADRDALVAKIYQGMKPGGLLVVSEKLNYSQPKIHQLLDDLYLDFKRGNGYSELEISQKRTALENVMKPDTLEDHQARFARAGFEESEVWYQCYRFASMIAVK